MHVEQFVMAYGAEQDRIRAILPRGFTSLRPVLRINAEIRDHKAGYVEYNTAVESDGKRGWLNIGFWKNVPFVREGKSVTFQTDFLHITFTGIGVAGSCPAEKDNDGCFFLGSTPSIRLPELITANKEFCDCTFAWHYQPDSAHGVSIGKTLPSIPTEVQVIYPHREFTPENASAIPCTQVLGSYTVVFER